MRGGCGWFYRGACTPRVASCRAARDDAARGVRQPRGDLIPPRQHLSESSSVFVHVSFFDRFSRAVLGVFRNSKWVMHHIVGDALGEPRVPRRSRSRYLSNAPGLEDQLVASRKDSASEGGCPEGKTSFTPSAFFLKSCPSSRAFLT